MTCNHEECKKLAELLGIEPDVWVKYGKLGFGNIMYELTCLKSELDPSNKNIIDEYSIYPCFQEAENFVKLLKLLSSKNGEGFRVIFGYDSGTNKKPRKDFAEIRYYHIFYKDDNLARATIKLLKDDRPLYGSKIKATFDLRSLITQAKQTDWRF